MVIHGVIHPKLKYLLSLCGHGDQILIADGNYPLASKAGSAEKIYLGLSAGIPDVVQVLNAVLEELHVEKASVMQPDDGTVPPVFEEFQKLLGGLSLSPLSRYDFYQACAQPVVRVAILTGEERVYSNILLTVGVA